MALTARSAATASERSTCSYGTPSVGAARSRTSGLPPAVRTASTVAAPSPDAPPVTRIVPSLLRPSRGEAAAADGLGIVVVVMKPPEEQSVWRTRQVAG